MRHVECEPCKPELSPLPAHDSSSLEFRLIGFVSRDTADCSVLLDGVVTTYYLLLTTYY